MIFYKEERLALFVDGANLYAAARSLGFDVDYKRLLDLFAKKGRLIRAFYYTTLIEDQEYSPIRPLIDWLDYNGYSMVTKPIKEFTDSQGRRKAKGSVVIIGSVAALHAFPGHPAYTASKGALPALVRQMALDYSPDIRINLVSPAQVVTPLLTDSIRAFENPEDILDETSRKLPMKRLGTVDDIAHTVLHLLSDNAGWITGSNFVVDGGFLAT